MSGVLRSRRAGAASALVAAVTLAACSSGSAPSTGGTTVPEPTPTSAAAAPTTDRLAVVTQVVEEVLTPLLRSADEAVGAGRDAITQHCAAPSPDSLATARDAVDAAIVAYERLDPVDMGPITLNRTDSQVAYAVDGPRVDELIASGAPTDVVVVNEMLPASTRGLLAAEHLLSGAAADGDPGACGFLTAIATNAADEMAAVITDSFDGSRGNPAYLNVLTGDANVAEEPQDTINVVVNMVLEILDEDAGMLHDPGDTAAPSVRRAARAHLATIADVWGDRSTGLSRLVDEELAIRVGAEIADTLALLDDDATSGIEAQQAVDGLRATIGTEVVTALDVIVGFTDNDGDS